MKPNPPLVGRLFRHVLALAIACLAFVCTSKAQTFPDPPVTGNGQVTVNLYPDGIASGWHFAGEKQWRNSGDKVNGLVAGVRYVEFRPVLGFNQPIPAKVQPTNVNPLVTIGRTYFEGGGMTGALTVTLAPTDLAKDTVPLDTRAQWRLLGEGDFKWRDSDVPRELRPGVYLVEVKPVAGKTTPFPTTVKVYENKNTTTTIAYEDTYSTTGIKPGLIDFESINDSGTGLPYAYVGQIRTSHSPGTGCVVLPHTVATAAHVVFDEDRLTYFEGLQWLFQRYPGVQYPKPMTPRRVGILTSYSDQRALDQSPGELSSEAKNCDVAALYFLSPPGRNGSSGYRSSDNVPNEYLTSSNLKTLVAYPSQGVVAGAAGKMHATMPFNVSFAANPDPALSRLYSTTDITSNYGAAGAPLFVKNGGGTYDCAGIYLGSAPQAEVRSIDSDVENLFIWAENDGAGPNGGISNVNGPVVSGGSSPGAIQIKLNPSSAKWKLGKSGSNRASGAKVSGLQAGNYRIYFTPVTGYQTFGPITVTVIGGQLTTKNVKYSK